MSKKLDILNQVMQSYTVDRDSAMNDINALLTNSDKEQSLISRLKEKIDALSRIHDSMRETEAFILQLTAERVIQNQVDSDGNVGDGETDLEK